MPACACVGGVRLHCVDEHQRRQAGRQASWANNGVELTGTSRALGVDMMGKARASAAGCRVAGTDAATGRARERRRRPGSARGQPGPWPSPRRSASRSFVRAAHVSAVVPVGKSGKVQKMSRRSIVGDRSHVQSCSFLVEPYEMLVFLLKKSILGKTERTIPLNNWMGA